MDGIEDHVLALVAAHMTGNDLAPAADHHLADIAPDPYLLMAEAHRHRVIIGPVTHQRLRRDLAAGLVTSLERGSRQSLHRRQIALQLADRLALAPQPVVLTLAALLLEPQVERLPTSRTRGSAP